MAIKNARKKGNNYELVIVNLFKKLGWESACSSRSESKRTDDAGIDCCYTNPFQIQAKAVERLGSYHDILARMPDGKGTYNLVFHKRNRKGTVVAMSQEDFLGLLQLLIENGIIKPK
jgi:hypothetical protein